MAGINEGMTVEFRSRLGLADALIKLADDRNLCDVMG
jgi:hypothetical protein